MYPKINYILHGHVYLHATSLTEYMIPCGSLEEVEEISKCNNYGSYSSFRINLKGHGFIALADTVERLKEMTLRPVARPLPEFMCTI
jgi:acetone carboxylase gamma subunit